MQKELDVNIDIDEDDDEDMTVHLFCDGINAMVLYDETLDKLSLEKNAIEKQYDAALDQCLDCEQNRVMIRGGAVGVGAMTVLGMCANMFQDLLISAGWLTIAGSIGLIGWHNRSKLKALNTKADTLQSSFEAAQQKYDDKVEEVAKLNAEKEKSMDYLYI